MAEEMPTPPVNNQPKSVVELTEEQKWQRLREKFTPTQIVILKLLNDGKPHLREELFSALTVPDITNRLYLNQHISDLRKRLRPMGHEIVCEILNRRISYRHVRLLHSPNNGYK
jgi:hypothetical protein